MQNLSLSLCLYVLFLLTIVPHRSPTFQLGSQYLACHMINMWRNSCKNSCRSDSTPSTNPATLLLGFANLLTKGRRKYAVTGSVRVTARVRVTVCINIRLLVLHTSVFGRWSYRIVSNIRRK